MSSGRRYWGCGCGWDCHVRFFFFVQGCTCGLGQGYARVCVDLGDGAVEKKWCDVCIHMIWELMFQQRFFFRSVSLFSPSPPPLSPSLFLSVALPLSRFLLRSFFIITLT
jgi:hypothetical protein